MNATADIARDLRSHLALAEEILESVQDEGQSFRSGDDVPFPEHSRRRQSLLPRLNQTLDNIRRRRIEWQRLSSIEKASCPEVALLLQENQDLIMKIVLLDRENEQTLLRRGLVPPRHLPPSQQLRPSSVAQLYRRHGTGRA